MLVWNKFINSLYESIIILSGARRAGGGYSRSRLTSISQWDAIAIGECHSHKE